MMKALIAGLIDVGDFALQQHSLKFGTVKYTEYDSVIKANHGQGHIEVTGKR